MARASGARATRITCRTYGYPSADGRPRSPLRPSELRAEIRAVRFTGPTAGQAPGFVQANLVVLPRPLAFDILVFAQRNPKSCPVLEVKEEVRDIHDRWSDDAAGFLTGCSFTFEEALLENGIPVR